MAYQANDGKQFTNRPMMKKHERSMGQHEEAKMATGHGAPEEGNQDMSDQPIEEMVKQHGPASEIHMEHDHEIGSHHVHSVHGGMSHHSDHESAEHAHEHAKKAAGIADKMKEFAGEEAAEGEGSIPGME